jgi:ATP adenylyltransferase
MGRMSDRLWAPWRMEYILGARGPAGAACIFCDFAASPPSEYRSKLVLVVQPHALVVLNRYPFASSHLLVAPRRHVGELSELPLEEYDATMRLVREAVTRLKAGAGAQGLNVGLNLGKAAGAGIAEHLHTHVVPRWAGDTNFMPVIANVRVMPEYLDEAWARLVPLFADVPGQHPSTI